MRSPRGFTLIEIIVAITLAAVVAAGLSVGIGSLVGTQARQSAAELAGTIRSLYDTASLTGKTCRLVFELPDERDDEGETKYYAECAAGNITTSRQRDDALKSDTRAREEERKAAASGNSFRRSTEGTSSFQDLLAQEKGRVDNAAKYAAFTAETIEPRTLNSSVRLAVWTKHQHDVVKQGLAYMYFFPQGFTEKAMVFVRQGSNVWTLTVSPLTGKTTVVSDELEVPRS